MTHSSNVVKLQPRRSRSDSRPAISLPAPMAKLRVRCGSHLKKLMARFFERIDDTFFKLADQAQTNSDQSAFFDAMREIRLKKSAIEDDFLDAYYHDFLFAEKDEDKTDSVIGCDSLSIVGEEEREEQVAIENISNRIKNEVGLDLEHLTLRFDALLPTFAVNENNNPVGAIRLAHNFARSCECLELDIGRKLVLYKIFEKQVLSQVKSMLAAANKYLIEQGVMPDLSAARPVNSTRSAGATGASASDRRVDSAGQHGSGQADFDSDSGPQIDTMALMAQVQKHMPGFDVQEARSLPVLRQSSLLNALSVAQDSFAHNKEQAIPVNEAGLINFVNLIQRMMRGKDGQPRARIDQSDQDAINLVTMLFDFILEDRQLEAPVKAILGRLQIPLVKVALADMSFFNKGGHVARRLLNDLAMAAVGWTEKGPGVNDPFLKKLESIVLKVVNGFNDDILVFEEALSEFHQFQDAEKKRRVMLEQRIKDSEEGKARTDNAKRLVQNDLNDLLSGHTLVDFIVNLLRDGWSNYMVLLSLKGGSENSDDSHHSVSAEYIAARELAAELIASTSLESERDILLMDEVEELVKGMKNGLLQTANMTHELELTLNELRDCIIDSNQLRLAEQMVADAEPVEVAPIITPAPLVDGGSGGASSGTNRAGHSEQGQSSDECSALASSRPAEVVDYTHLKAGSQARQSTPVAAIPESPRADRPVVLDSPKIALLNEEVDPAAEVEPGYLEFVERLSVGSWVEIHDTEDKKYRCKLAAIIKSCDKYIFVNRMGVKVAEKTKVRLAKDISNKSVCLLDDGLLFDRALESVISSLRA